MLLHYVNQRLLFWKPRREVLLCPRDDDSCCPDGRRRGGGGEEGEEGKRQEEEEGGSRDTVTCRRTHMVLPQRSADHRGSPNLLLSLKLHSFFFFFFKKKTFSVFIFFFLPASFLLPQPIVGRTWVGKAAPWPGRTETPAEERRGKNKSTTSRRFLILKKSSAREYTRLCLTSLRCLYDVIMLPLGFSAPRWVYSHLNAHIGNITVFQWHYRKDWNFETLFQRTIWTICSLRLAYFNQVSICVAFSCRTIYLFS